MSTFCEQLKEYHTFNKEAIRIIEDSEVSIVLASKDKEKSLLIGRAFREICDTYNIAFASIAPGSLRKKGVRINISTIKGYPKVWLAIRTLAHFLLIDDDVLSSDTRSLSKDHVNDKDKKDEKSDGNSNHKDA